MSETLLSRQVEDLAQRIESEADTASRAGQHASLHRIADDLRALLAATAPTPDEVGLVEVLSAAERSDLLQALTAGRTSDAIAKHGPPMAGSLMLQALQGECVRMVEHVAPAVERIINARLVPGLDETERTVLSDALDPIVADYVGEPVSHTAIAHVLDMAQAAIEPAVERILAARTGARA